MVSLLPDVSSWTSCSTWTGGDLQSPDSTTKPSPKRSPPRLSPIPITLVSLYCGSTLPSLLRQRRNRNVFNNVQHTSCGRVPTRPHRTTVITLTVHSHAFHSIDPTILTSPTCPSSHSLPHIQVATDHQTYTDLFPNSSPPTFGVCVYHAGAAAKVGGQRKENHTARAGPPLDSLRRSHQGTQPPRHGF
jgi:hypothetical protein